MRRAILMLSVALVAVLIATVPSLSAQTNPPQASQTSFVGSFAGAPGLPTFFRPPGWDVTVFGHNDGSIIPMLADHGPDCQGPPTTYAPDQLALHMHQISTTQAAVYQCADHLMTAIWSGYGAVYLTPPAMMDFTNGTSTWDWHMSTRRTGSRDWVDFVIMPWDDNQQSNFEDFHVPNNGVHVQLAGGGNVLLADIIRTGAQQSPNWSGSCEDVPQPTICHIGGDSYHTWNYVLGLYGLTTSPARREHFQIQLSRTHIKVGMPDYNFYWIDGDINPPLAWTQGVVTLNQRTYNVEKSCSDVEDPNQPYDGVIHSAAADDQQTGCPPNTWHWSDVAINPSTPFVIIPSQMPSSDTAVRNPTLSSVHFAAPAPTGAYFHGAGGPSPTQASYDGGATWHNLAIVGPQSPPEGGDSYWDPMPAGTQDVLLRGANSGTSLWSVQDMTIWSKTVSVPPIGPTPTLVPTVVPVNTPPPVPPTPTIAPTFTPLPALTTTPTATATTIATVGTAGLQTVTFDASPHPAIGPFSGQYPSGVIEWGTNQWYYSGPYAQFASNSIGFNGGAPTSATFNWISPKTLVSIDVDNGGSSASTITLACDSNTPISQNVAPHTAVTITSNWTQPCTTVTVGSSNGWDSNFDNLTYR